MMEPASPFPRTASSPPSSSSSSSSSSSPSSSAPLWESSSSSPPPLRRPPPPPPAGRLPQSSTTATASTTAATPETEQPSSPPQSPAPTRGPRQRGRSTTPLPLSTTTESGDLDRDGDGDGDGDNDGDGDGQIQGIFITTPDDPGVDPTVRVFGGPASGGPESGEVSESMDGPPASTTSSVFSSGSAGAGRLFSPQSSTSSASPSVALLSSSAIAAGSLLLPPQPSVTSNSGESNGLLQQDPVESVTPLSDGSSSNSPLLATSTLPSRASTLAGPTSSPAGTVVTAGQQGLLSSGNQTLLASVISAVVFVAAVCLAIGAVAVRMRRRSLLSDRKPDDDPVLIDGPSSHRKPSQQSMNGKLSSGPWPFEYNHRRSRLSDFSTESSSERSVKPAEPETFPAMLSPLAHFIQTNRATSSDRSQGNSRDGGRNLLRRSSVDSVATSTSDSFDRLPPLSRLQPVKFVGVSNSTSQYSKFSTPLSGPTASTSVSAQPPPALRRSNGPNPDALSSSSSIISDEWSDRVSRTSAPSFVFDARGAISFDLPSSSLRSSTTGGSALSAKKSDASWLSDRSDRASVAAAAAAAAADPFSDDHEIIAGGAARGRSRPSNPSPTTLGVRVVHSDFSLSSSERE